MKSIKKGKQPYKVAIPAEQPKNFSIQLSFERHYLEPDVLISVDTEQLIKEQKLEYLMVFDAGKSGNWELVLTHNANKEMIGLADFKQIPISK